MATNKAILPSLNTLRDPDGQEYSLGPISARCIGSLQLAQDSKGYLRITNVTTKSVMVTLIFSVNNALIAEGLPGQQIILGAGATTDAIIMASNLRVQVFATVLMSSYASSASASSWDIGCSMVQGVSHVSTPNTTYDMPLYWWTPSKVS